MPRRKRGSRRIDAALDAMRAYGFSGHLVRETVKELLHVYGGDAGWIFVEEASYTLLIETILEKQKDVVGQEIDEALPIEDPSPLNEVSYSATEAVDIPHLTREVSDSPSQTTDHDIPQLTREVSDSPSQTADHDIPQLTREVSQTTDHDIPQLTREVSDSPSQTTDHDIPQLTREVSDSPSQTTDHGGDVEAPQSRILAAQSTPRFHRRKPYYGWISGDSEEEDLIDLLPAHTNEELSKLLHRWTKQKRHKT